MLREAASRFPDDSTLRTLRLEYLEQHAENLELAEYMVEIAESAVDEAFAVGWLARAGKLFVALDLGERAVPLLQRTIASSPLDLASIALLADLMVAQRDFDGASDLLARTLSRPETADVDPAQTLPLLRAQATLLRARYDNAGAFEILNRAHELDRDEPHTAIALSEVAHIVGDYELGGRLLRQLAAMEEASCPLTQTDIFLRQARLWHSASDPRKASFWLHKAKHRDPQHPEVLALLEELAAGPR